MNGCEMMKCTNYDNGRCTNPGDFCKYRSHSSVQSTSLLALPEDVRSFIERVTLHLQSSRSKTPEQHDSMFHEAYRLYGKYDVEGRRANNQVDRRGIPRPVERLVGQSGGIE